MPLKDVNGNQDNGLKQILFALGVNIRRVSEGVYDGCGFNFGNCVDKPGGGWENYWRPTDWSTRLVPYGVGDSIEQVMSILEPLIEADAAHDYAVGFTEVRREDEPESGGWRWHKWGEYIGMHEPKYEYLHDEKNIESIVVFSVLRRPAKALPAADQMALPRLPP